MSEELYFVVINHEEQYSIWRDNMEVPAGWKTIGEAQTKDQCLAYIKEHWTDMRPKSLRDWMDRQASKGSGKSN